MKKNLFWGKTLVRAVSALLAAIMLSVSMAGCSARVKDPIMEYENYGISKSFYEFMLSRTKGELGRKKLDVEPASELWTKKVEATGESFEQYYNRATLDKCRNYLAAMVLFDKEGFKLANDAIAEIDEEIEFYLQYDGNGSEKKLDAILSKYGVSAEELREIYIMEAKYRELISKLYGSISDGVKQEYYEQNYVRFKQIFISNFYYKYQTDEQGNVIYFDPETSKPIYDIENGKVIYVEGYSIKDQFDQPIYYDENGRIVYDTEKGYPTPELDENGEAVTYKYTDEQMKEREAEAKALGESLMAGNYAAFEAEMPKWELYEGSDEYYADGYYLSRIESHGYQKYMLDILEKLEGMNDGDIGTVESDMGYHIIMKYELDDGKFGNSEYAEWFASFESSLQNKLFLDRCAKFYFDIKINDETLAGARSIKQMGTNYNY